MTVLAAKRAITSICKNESILEWVLVLSYMRRGYEGLVIVKDFAKN
jgi:hypothetical protein